MGYSERAVDACVKAIECGIVSDSHYRAIAKCKSVNVQPLSRFLLSRNPVARIVVAKSMGLFGDVAPVVDAALREEDSSVLTEMLKVLGNRGEGLEALERMLCSDDAIVREEVIRMFRRAGQQDVLCPLLFDKDEHLVCRIKRYVTEQEIRENPTE